jgi:hypothetical protein
MPTTTTPQSIFDQANLPCIGLGGGVLRCESPDFADALKITNTSIHC